MTTDDPTMAAVAAGVQLGRDGQGPGARMRLAAIDVLADDDHGRLVRTGLEHVRAALDAGSTDPLPSAP